MEVTLRRQRLRCALCHDEAVGHLVRCRFCGAFMHTECKAEFGRCPSLGCVASAPPLPPLPPPVVIELGEEPPDPAPPASSPRPRRRFGSASSWWALGAVLASFLLFELVTWAPDPATYRAAQRAQLQTDARVIRRALEQHRAESGRWARSLDDLLTPAGPRGPYLDERPCSLWGKPYRLVWEERRAYVLASDDQGHFEAALVLRR